jgi:hypothetical protein
MPTTTSLCFSECFNYLELFKLSHKQGLETSVKGLGQGTELV